MSLAEVEARGLAMRAFCDRVRRRGDVATIEEQIDLPALRAAWRAARARELGTCTLNNLGPTPLETRRLDAIREQIAARERRRRHGARRS